MPICHNYARSAVCAGLLYIMKLEAAIFVTIVSFLIISIGAIYATIYLSLLYKYVIPSQRRTL